MEYIGAKDFALHPVWLLLRTHSSCAFHASVHTPVSEGSISLSPRLSQRRTCSLEEYLPIASQAFGQWG
jgi:hypothetical protein